MFETIVIGNVGSCKFVNPGGKMAVLNISLASSRRVGETEYTDWTSVKVWGERAIKLQEHVAKGMKLLVRGRPEAKGYQRDDGTVAGELILHVADLEFLSPKQQSTHPENEPSMEYTAASLSLDAGDAKPATKRASRIRS